MASKERLALRRASSITLLASLLCSGPVEPMTEAITLSPRMTALVMVEPMSMPAKYCGILIRPVLPDRLQSLDERVDLVSRIHLGVGRNVDDVALQDQGREFPVRFFLFAVRDNVNRNGLVDLSQLMELPDETYMPGPARESLVHDDAVDLVILDEADQSFHIGFR